MLDIELYRAILGPPIPWTVLGVDLDVKLFLGHYTSLEGRPVLFSSRLTLYPSPISP